MSAKASVSRVKHPRYAWRVTYSDGEERKQKYFKKKTGEGGADEFKAEKDRELAARGAEEKDITKEERRAVLAFREAVATLPTGGETKTLGEAVDFYVRHLRERHKAIPCEILAERLIARLKANRNSAQHIYSTERRLRRFSADYGDWLACDISTDIVSEWLGRLGVGAQTVRHYRAALHQLFELARDQGAAASNPVAKAINPKVSKREVGILTPAEAEAILTHADSRILPALAIGLFAGIRRAELARLDWSEIDFDGGHIEIKASKAKSAQRRLIRLQPNLAAWLTPKALQKGNVMPSEMIYRNSLTKTLDAAGIDHWPHNCLRHSFASYHLAHFKDASALALELGHTGTDLLFRHYRELVKPAAAEAYWNLTPAENGKVTPIKSA